MKNKGIAKKWTCLNCPEFELKIEDNNPDLPLEAILKVALARHQGDGHQVIEADLTDAEIASPDE